MWGVVLSCFAAVENYAGAIAVRFFLGVFESAVTPGFALFTSQWYVVLLYNCLACTNLVKVHEKRTRHADRNLVLVQWLCAGKAFINFLVTI